VSTGTAQGAAHPFGNGVAQGIAELLVSGSLEMSPEQIADAPAIAALLPAGTRVYVNHLPHHGLGQSLASLEALRAQGLEPVPHVAARRIASQAEFSTFLKRAAGEAAVTKVLLLGGDEPRPLGPYADAEAVLREGILAEHGVREIGLAGYPEGHPRIPRAVLERALAGKLALVSAHGMSAYIMTQFSFAPARVVEYCGALARKLPAIPVYVGLAGPSDARTLLRYAQICGVSASLRALQAQGMDAIRLFTHTDPLDQLAAIAHYCRGQRSCNVVGAHFFSFGGAEQTAAWLRRQIVSADAA
jgi:methylenetetrahydrofolate reductase (NADPH)